MATRAVSIAMCLMALMMVPRICVAASNSSGGSFEGQLPDVVMRFSVASPRQVSGVGSRVSFDTPLGRLSGNSFAGMHKRGQRPVIGARFGMQYDASALAVPLSVTVDGYRDPTRESDTANGCLELLSLPVLRLSRLVFGHLTLSEHADLQNTLISGGTMVAWSTQPVALLGFAAWSQGSYTTDVEVGTATVDNQLALAPNFVPALSLSFDFRANASPEGLAPSFAGVTIAAAHF